MKCNVCSVCGTPFIARQNYAYCSAECQEFVETRWNELVAKINDKLSHPIKSRLDKALRDDEWRIKCERNNIVYSFSSLKKCAEFLSAELHWPIDVCLYYLRQQQPVIDVWRITYDS